MRLAELSAASGVSSASIKFYRREDLLPPGEQITATRAAYGERHLVRLRTIQVLRELLDAPIDDIRHVTALLDREDPPVLDIMQAAQDLALGVSPRTLTQEPDASAGDEAARRARDRVAALVEVLGWPDADSHARDSLVAWLAAMDRLEVVPDDDTLRRYGAVIDGLAARDLSRLTAGEPTLDDMVVSVAVGTYTSSRLLARLLGLGHTSYSIRAAGPPPPPPPG